MVKEDLSGVMTDRQFDSIIEMVIQILNRSVDLNDAKAALTAIKQAGSEGGYGL